MVKQNEHRDYLYINGNENKYLNHQKSSSLIKILIRCNHILLGIKFILILS